MIKILSCAEVSPEGPEAGAEDLLEAVMARNYATGIGLATAKYVLAG
jgi:hypothetical protein